LFLHAIGVANQPVTARRRCQEIPHGLEELLNQRHRLVHWLVILQEGAVRSSAASSIDLTAGF
jgi:hypothetical protein